ncbi:MAG: hypothetical protein HZB59_02065 [Ignavibacteriales bacterium]|nr:hypothetical protein [Ignavibacteriales bacterium]
MRRLILSLMIIALPVATLVAQTADEIITKYIKTVGGSKNIQAAKTLVRTGKFIGGGGFEAAIRSENKRPNLVREEFTIQGMTGVNVYDGKTGWKIEPWSGKRDPESLGEEEMKQIIESSDFDGPLVDYQKKGNTVKLVGVEPVEGTDALKLEVKLASGDVHYYYMDTDYYVPIKIGIKRTIRGEDREYEISLGDYKEVDGWYLPFSFEANAKGSQDRSKVTYDKIEVNIPIKDDRFMKPDAPSNSTQGK